VEGCAGGGSEGVDVGGVETGSVGVEGADVLGTRTGGVWMEGVALIRGLEVDALGILVDEVNNFMVLVGCVMLCSRITVTPGLFFFLDFLVVGRVDADFRTEFAFPVLSLRASSASASDDSREEVFARGLCPSSVLCGCGGKIGLEDEEAEERNGSSESGCGGDVGGTEACSSGGGVSSIRIGGCAGAEAWRQSLGSGVGSGVRGIMPRAWRSPGEVISGVRAQRVDESNPENGT
jgi:hypothetical protein